MLFINSFVDLNKRDKKSKGFIFPKNCLCKYYNKRIKQKHQQGRCGQRCTKGYECKYTAKEKLKHIVSKEALNIDGLGKGN